MRTFANALAIALVLLTAFHSPASRADAVIPLADGIGAPAVNSITDRIYVVGDSTAPKLFEINGANHAIRSVALGGTWSGGWRLVIDPIRNRIYVVTGGNLSVVDGRTMTVQNVAVGSVVSDLAIDPGANVVWVGHNGTLTRVDGATLATQTLAVSPGNQRLAVDPIARRLYVGGSGPNLVEIDEATLATRTLVTASVGGFNPLAVDPFSRTLHAIGFSQQVGLLAPVLWVVDTDTFTVDTTMPTDVNPDENAVSDLGADPVHGRIWVHTRRIFSGCPGELFALSATTLVRVPGSEVTSPGGCYIWGWSMNPATNLVYGSNAEFFGPPAEVAILDADGPVTAAPHAYPAPYDSIGGIAVNPATNRVYATTGEFFNFAADDAVIEFAETETTPVPITTTITSDPPGPLGAVGIQFAAVSTFAPNALPIRQIYYQVDAIDGPWLAASPSGAAASVTLSGLSAGPHIVHAFAVDGQEATIGSIQTPNPIVGATASHAFTVPAPPACSNGLDDDGDSLIDHPADPGCLSATWTLEDPQCANGVDDDGDFAIDYPADTRCRSAWDNDEATDPGSCGLGAELVLVFAMLGGARSRFERKRG